MPMKSRLARASVDVFWASTGGLIPKTPTRSPTLLFTLLVLTAAPTHAAVKCVNPGGTDSCFAKIQDAIDAAGDHDTIQIAAGKYNELVSINKSLLIQGAGAEKTTVYGTGILNPGNNAVFQFPFNPPSVTVTISDMTIRGGYRGVDASRFNNLTLQNVVVRDNGPGSGAGVFTNASSVTIIGSTIKNNTTTDTYFGCDGSGGAGGGIASLCGTGNYTIINSAVINNTARIGGGIAIVNGRHTIINSTLSGNKATELGGAIVSFSNYSIDIANSTIAANTTLAMGIPEGSGALALFDNCCGAPNSQIKASVLDGNTGGNCSVQVPTKVDSLGYNVSSDATCAPFLTGTDDLNSTNARLKPLQNNGGLTPTHALRANSPAIDHVSKSICPAPATDQRGVKRPQGAACDSGAYESDHGDNHGGDY